MTAKSRLVIPAEQHEPDPRDPQLLPVRICTPAGEVLLDEQVPGGRTVRSVLQTFRAEKRGRLTLLHGTQVVSQSKRLWELDLTEEDSLCLVRRATSRYTSWTENGDGNPPEHHLVKCLLIGAAQVGKSVWMQAFCREQLPSQYHPTIGVEFKLLRLESEDGVRLKIQLWDTAGQQRFRAITNAYFRGASGIMAFFSLRSRESLAEVLQMVDEAAKKFPESCRCVCLVGTHADLPDPAVSQEEAEELAKGKGWPFFPISLDSPGAGVDDPLFGWLDMFMDDSTCRS